MKHLIQDFLQDESGQTSTEYILLIAVVAIVIFKLKGEMSTRLNDITTKVFTKAGGLANEIGAE